VRII
jgi:hypothetical protein